MKKLVVLSFVGFLAVTPITAMANEDLEARIAALEERVSALEAQASVVPDGVSAVQDSEPAELEDVETGMVAGGCSLSFKRAEVAKDNSGNDAVIMYFDFTNESGDNKSAGDAFYVKIFQHDREMSYASVYDNPAVDDKYTEFRSGADPVEVGFASEIADTSDIIINISSMEDWEAEDVEFTVSLE